MNIRKTLGKIYVPIRYNMFKYSPKRFWPILIKVTMLIELGEAVNLNKPKTINEKIQWLKINDNRPIKSLLADKYEVRGWIEKNIGGDYLIPLLGVWNDFSEIDFESLPKQFVLKATHGCGCNIIVKDKNLLDIDKANKLFNKWFKTNYAYNTGERHYESIKPRIIAEQFLENDGGELSDYKVFCFNGKAKYIMYLCDRDKGLKMAFYDTDWNKQPFTYSYPQLDKEVPRPNCLTELLELSEIIARDFAFVRVDFYILNDGTIKFGEVTLASAGGFCKWYPSDYNLLLGNMVDLEGFDYALD